jgi:Fe-S cluster biogenesis protein NfuA
MKDKIQHLINKVGPWRQQDGGDVEFIDFVNGVVKVRLIGACYGCPMSQITLKDGIEKLLKKEIPEIKFVENIGIE